MTPTSSSRSFVEPLARAMKMWFVWVRRARASAQVKAQYQKVWGGGDELSYPSPNSTQW